MTTEDEFYRTEPCLPYPGCIVGGLIGLALPGLYGPARYKKKPL